MLRWRPSRTSSESWSPEPSTAKAGSRVWKIERTVQPAGRRCALNSGGSDDDRGLWVASRTPRRAGSRSPPPSAPRECLEASGNARFNQRRAGQFVGFSPGTHQHRTPAGANCCQSLLLDPDAMILIDLRKRLFLLVSGRGKYAPDFPYHGCALPTELGQASSSSLEASDAGVDAAGRAPRWPGCSVVMPSRRMQSDHTAVTNPRRLGLAWRVQQEAVKAVGRNEAASSGSSTVNSPASAPRMLNRGEAAWACWSGLSSETSAA